MNSNPWQVDSIQTFYCLKCPECMFFSHEEFNFKHHALENHPLSYFLFGKSENNEEMAQNEENSDMYENYENVPSTSINSNSLIDCTMIKKESFDLEIKDNNDFKPIEMSDEYFVPTTNFKDDYTIIKNENSEYLESYDGIKAEEKSESVFAESIDPMEGYLEETEFQNEPFYNFSQSFHEGKKQFKCDSCSSSFTQKRNLAAHIRLVHEGINTFLCEICNKAFGSNSAMKKHVSSVHEGKKPFKCESCGSKFTQKKKPGWTH